jgi:cation diffusion facilitator family transporter
MSVKVKTARLSIMSNTSLIIMKLIVGIVTGSVSIISEAIHSTMDLVAAIIAFFSVKISDTPPDEDHPYGHGKVENVSGVIEALLILVATALIIIEAIKKIVSNEPIKSIGVGFLVMFASALVNFIVSRKLYKVAKQEESIALEADALHLKADVYTSLGVGGGLLLIWVLDMIFKTNKVNYLDPVIAILVAIFILKEAIELLKNAFAPLLDAKLSDEDILVIKKAIEKEKGIYCNFHELRTRRAGSVKNVDLHLVVPQGMSVKQAHDICDKIEEDVENELSNTQIMIHVEPCPKRCDACDSKEHIKYIKEYK